MHRNDKGEVCFTCNICKNDFWERPSLFLMGGRRKKENCPNCIKIRIESNKIKNYERIRNYRETHVYDKESFIRKLEEKFHGFYDTSLVNYINMTSNVILIHDGHEIITSPSCVLNSKKPVLQNRIKDTESFITKATIVHSGKYSYFHTSYKNAIERVIITCPKHGEFLQQPNNHLSGAGCPYCKNSRMEEAAASELRNFGIKFFQGYHIKWLGRQHLDFYLPDYNVAIECQGHQHFSDVVIYDTKENNIERDLLKKIKCSENGIEKKHPPYSRDFSRE